MAHKKNSNQAMDRITASLAATFGPTGPDNPHGYELSSSFTIAERRRLLGNWQIVEHLVDGQDYVRYFMETTLKGMELAEAEYLSSYQFLEGIIIRRSTIIGQLLFQRQMAPYSYNLSMSLQWSLEPHILVVQPVMAYQYASLNGEPAAVRELPQGSEWIRVHYQFDHKDLVITDGGDTKRLSRVE